MPDIDELPDFLTRRETSALLRISLRTLDTYILDRTIPHIKLGGRTLFRRSAIVETMNKLEVPAES